MVLTGMAGSSERMCFTFCLGGGVRFFARDLGYGTILLGMGLGVRAWVSGTENLSGKRNRCNIPATAFAFESHMMNLFILVIEV